MKITPPQKVEGFTGKNFELSLAATCSGSAIKNLIYHLFRFDISEEIKSIKMPILFITGTKDMFYNQRRRYRAMPNANVKIVPKGVHVLHLTTQEVNEWILTFIKT